MKKTVITCVTIALLATGCADKSRLAAKPPSIMSDTATEAEKDYALSITKLIEGNFDNISDAYVVLSGDTAIVGIDLKAAIGDGDLINLKRKIESIVLQNFSNVSRVSITSAPELIDRIVNMIGDEKEAGRHNSDLKEFYELTPMI